MLSIINTNVTHYVTRVKFLETNFILVTTQARQWPTIKSYLLRFRPEKIIGLAGIAKNNHQHGGQDL